MEEYLRKIMKILPSLKIIVRNYYNILLLTKNSYILNQLFTLPLPKNPIRNITMK